MFAALETAIITLPLGLALLLIVPQLPDEGFGYLIWGFFSAAVAGAAPLVLRAFAPRICASVPGLDDARLDRLASMVFGVIFVVLLPVWFAVFAPAAGLNVWARIAIVPAFAVVGTLCVRFIALPSYWARYRSQVLEAGLELGGNELGVFAHPRYYDEDVRWVVSTVWKRLTSASSRRREVIL